MMNLVDVLFMVGVMTLIVDSILNLPCESKLILSSGSLCLES